MPMSGKHPCPITLSHLQARGRVEGLVAKLQHLGWPHRPVGGGAASVGTRDGEGLEADIAGAIIIIRIATQYEMRNYS